MGWISEKLKTLGRIWDIQNMFEPNEIVNLKKIPKLQGRLKKKIFPLQNLVSEESGG